MAKRSEQIVMRAKVSEDESEKLRAGRSDIPGKDSRAAKADDRKLCKENLYA